MKGKKSFDVVITGVGGQGVLLLTEILGNAALEEGLDALSSEVHGMAQRGGVVTSFVRMGREIYASTVSEGCADSIVALEPAETLRVLRYANPSTLILMNTTPVVPPSVTLGLNPYPRIELIVDECGKATESVVTLDALSVAKKAGNPRMQNVVMLGYLAATGLLPLSMESLKKGISKTILPEYLSMNLKAFNLGCQARQRAEISG